MRRGTRVANAYVAISADGDGINEEIVDAFDDAGPAIEKKGEEHGEAYGDNFSEGFLSRMRGKVSKRLSNVFDGKSIGSDAGDEAGQSFVERMSEKVSGLGDKIGAELSDRMASNPEQIRRGVDRAFDDDFADRIGDRMGSRFMQSFSAAIEDEESKLGQLVDKMLSGAVSGNGKKSGGIGDMIGRMLGKGSRNNALNLFGRSIGGIVSLMDKGAKFASGFASGLSKAADGASLIQKFLSGLSGGAGASGLASSFSTFAASAPVVVAAIAVIIVAVSALASVVGALLGLVVALASTIASALVGAAVVGAGAFAALGAAAGLATLAFTSMTDKQRAAAAETFEPIHQMAAGLGQIMMKSIIPAFSTWSRNLQDALYLVKPLAQVMGGAFATAGNSLTKSLSGPGFQKLISTLKTELPSIVTSLSSAFGKFLNGVSGMFSAIMPYVTRFATYLDKTAGAFSRWANSTKGQNSIVDFVGRAVDALKSLWGFVKEFSGFISDVLFDPASQKAGNTIFDALKDAFARFRRAINSGDLERWFNDAIAFAKDLKVVVRRLSDTFMALYDSGVLEGVGDGLQLIADVVGVLNAILKPLVKAFGITLQGAMEGLSTPMSILKIGFDNLAGAAGYLADKANAAIDALDRLKNMGPSGILGAIGDKIDDNTIDPTEILPRLTGRMAGSAGLLTQRMSQRGSTAAEREFARRSGDRDDLIKSGEQALSQTSESHGGHKQEPSSGSGGNDGSNVGKSGGKKKGGTKEQHELGPQFEWKNPFLELANRILSQGAKVADEIRAAFQDARDSINAVLTESIASMTAMVTEAGKSLTGSVAEAAKSVDAGAVASSFQSMIDQWSSAAASSVTDAAAAGADVLAQAKAAGEQMIATAQAARQSAAQELASASNPKEAKAALALLVQADADLNLAKSKAQDLMNTAQATADQMSANATATSDKISAATAIMAAQMVLNVANVQDLLGRVSNSNATLADYAEARRIVAERLAAANEKLAEAISLRDSYSASVSDSVKSFGSLMTAQAKTLNGVAQALTSGDITDNLRDRLTKIKKFQDNLRVLLAQGLSDSAYKQLVDAGVESGGAFAQALVDGGQGGISEVNNLTGQIDSAAATLGGAAASHLYQAGVDAAQGLVDGLMSLSADLESAATQLGNTIAQAIKNALGIASPSRVLRRMMGPVGDGTVLGLDDQHTKVDAAAARLASRVAVSPEVASYASRQSPSTDGTVSGNSDAPKFLWTGDIVTPTEDPQAVTTEVLNELTARL